MNDLKDIKQSVDEVLLKVRPEVDFDLENNLITDGILDSLDVMEIVEKLENAFGVAIPPMCLSEDNFNSEDAIVKTIVELLND